MGTCPVHIEYEIRIRELALDVIEEEMLDIVQYVDTICRDGSKELAMIPLGDSYQVVAPNKTSKLTSWGDTLEPSYRKNKAPGRGLTDAISTLHESLGQVMLDELATLQ